MEKILWFVAGVVVTIFAYNIYMLIYIYSYKIREPTEKDIEYELQLMELERKHFGHVTCLPERQTKEYKEWLKNHKLYDKA